MAHPYSTEARLKRFAAGKGERLRELLDRNLDGIADTDGTVSVLESVLERAANRIDSRLGVKYAVPFASTTPSASNDQAPTYGAIADLADLFATARLSLWVDPKDQDGLDLMAEFDDEVAFLLGPNGTIPGAALAESGTTGRTWGFESLGTHVAGGVTNGRTDAEYTDDTVDQSRGI